jgi:4-amino-4-deoxy-L-arabinose transferase-like glycosyltransferase
MAPSPQPQTPLWLRPPALIACVATLVAIRLFVSGSTELVRDEAYYALWSTVPSAGYLDHPPMVAWVVAAGRALLGETALAVRLFSALSTAIIAFAIYRAGRVLFDARVGGLATIWFALTPGNALLFLATPDAPVVTFWALTVWAVAEFVARRNANWWLLAGIFAGLALSSKYTAFALGAGLVVYLVTSRERLGWLRLWQLWAGGGLALLILLPNLLWNFERGWASFAFQGKRLTGYGTTTGSTLGDFGELIAGQAVAMGVLLFVFTLIGIIAFVWRIDRPGRPNLSLPIFTAVPIVLWFLWYVFQFRVEANWLLPIWPMLSLVAAWAAVQIIPGTPVWRWLLTGMRWLQAPLTAALTLLLYAHLVWGLFPLPPGTDRTRDLHGWAAFNNDVDRYAAEAGVRWIAAGIDDYGLVGELSAHARATGAAVPVRAVDMPERYGFLAPLEATALAGEGLYVQSTVVYPEPPDVFETIELIGEAQRRDRDLVLETFKVYRVTGAPPVLAGDAAAE